VVVKVITDEEILATRDVMRQLRPHVLLDEYVPTVRRMIDTNGYQLAALYDGDAVRAVAGYRYMEMLYSGKIMYVDDLNTDERYRSKGHGKELMEWLKAEAKTEGCAELHLDSGVQREHTHRFYFRERFTINCYHFRLKL
jgi:GNAT superfamily N-acetyltransferase